MDTPIMITLIICLTIIILFGTIMISAAVLSKNKQEKTRISVCRNCAAQIKEYK